MADLDWSVDKSRMIDLLRGFPRQCEEAVERGEGVEVGDLSRYENILIAGMGGSAIGGDLLKASLSRELRFPICVNRDYTLPQWVGEHTLLFASSYSGNTEETLSAYEEGKSKAASVISITSGGRLAELSAEDGYPSVKVPSGLPPRCALGYLFIPMLVLLSRGGVVEDKRGELRGTIGILKQMEKELSGSESRALELAGRLLGKLPVVYSSERLGVAARRWGTQLNENAKTFAHVNVLPELSHNEVCGWDQPEGPLKETEVVFLRDSEEHPKMERRIEVTKEILGPMAEVSQVWAEGESLLSKLLSLIYFGDYVSYYVALLSGKDPTPVERIDYLKQRLG